MKAQLETNDERRLTACAHLRVNPDLIEIWRGLSGSRWRYRSELPALNAEGFGPDAESALAELVDNLESIR
jgi:hypothetical protein